MMQQDSLEPAAIRFTLERLQPESARRSEYFLPTFFMHLLTLALKLKEAFRNN